ncbi:hypothetical protein LOD99_10669 [Oopsacas minuta]|uniref:BZIP domain-containing protein n=1 Tax=Oopsacas minuta TaxID=111878 RepID=A0AAV7KFW7_9METZ|nr:hypothetical protein LOD99_10669 [Oopsacas minuta]
MNKHALLPIAKDGFTYESMREMTLIEIIDEIKLATRGLLEVRSIYNRARLTSAERDMMKKCRKRVRTRLAKRNIRNLKQEQDFTEIRKLMKERDDLVTEKNSLIQEVTTLKSTY